MKNLLKKNYVIRYILTFLGVFGVLFYGTEAIIGLSAPGNSYSPFVSRYLDFITPFRDFLLEASVGLLSLFDFKAAFKNDIIYHPGGVRLRMAYDCIGYGVISFWIAFIAANRGGWRRKLVWMTAGATLLCGINILRVCLLLVALQRGWPIPLGWDHHTWFNIACYLLIFGMIFRFDKSGKQQAAKRDKEEINLPAVQKRSMLVKGARPETKTKPVL